MNNPCEDCLVKTVCKKECKEKEIYGIHEYTMRVRKWGKPRN